MSEICSKLTTKTPERRYWRHLVSLLLPLNRFYKFCRYFHSSLWTSKFTRQYFLIRDRVQILLKCQRCSHKETSQLICSSNQLIGFYMRATLAFHELSEWINFNPLVLIHVYQIEQKLPTKCHFKLASDAFAQYL